MTKLQMFAFSFLLTIGMSIAAQASPKYNKKRSVKPNTVAPICPLAITNAATDHQEFSNISTCTATWDFTCGIPGKPGYGCSGYTVVFYLYKWDSDGGYWQIYTEICNGAYGSKCGTSKSTGLQDVEALPPPTNELWKWVVVWRLGTCSYAGTILNQRSLAFRY